MSLKLLKAASNRKLEGDNKGILLQKITAERAELLSQYPLTTISNPVNPRLHLAQYFGKLAAEKVTDQIR